MKRLSLLGLILVLIPAALSASRENRPADTEAEGHALEAEVNGYHIALTSQNEWAKGDNTILATLTDAMGAPVNNAEVQLLIMPTLDTHGESEASPARSDHPGETVAGTDMGSGASHGSAAHIMPASAPEPASHGAEAAAPAALMAFHGEGTYIVQAHLASTGTHDVRAMVHVGGEMLQADFVVGGTASSPRSIVLWGFAGINAAIVLSAALLRKSRLETLRNGVLA